MNINDNIKAKCITDGVMAMYLRAGAPIPVCIKVAPHYQSFNALIGADTGDCVSLRLRDPRLERLSLWVDDNGLLIGRCFNEMASRLYQSAIAGDALVLAYNKDGECVDLSMESVLAVAAAATSPHHG